MGPYRGDFTTSDTVYVMFDSFSSDDPSASVTLTGLAVTDIEIYKNGSTTQRASDSGYTLLDTDGIDFDTITGIHGFSIDLSDNTDAGFYTSGGEFDVIVSSVTIDGATINFHACSFSIDRIPRVNVAQWLGTAAATPTTAGVPEVDVTHLGGAAQSATDLKDFADAGYDPATNKVQGVVLVDTTTTNTDMRGTDSALLAASAPTNFGDLSITATTGRVDVASVGGTAQTANDNGADINLILADTNELQTDLTDGGRLDLLIDSIISLLDDARAEPGQGAPPVNPDIVTKVDYLYKAWRNKVTQTSTTYSLFDDAGSTVDQKATVSDDGTTATRGEIGTGP